ncbi:uncharacterized protein LAESUDRAFT_646353 [Laetiporus sulphureus 93-53]|uniref:PQ-loop-domain-containing protein n=1 Tax=Laetiporus sulphureus 93-53 TaxID=1314785 RepID=A0A165FX09_9APHY|nr:uncharacterized protein LAESUDRAFT_646353 [Laetiporus sulphureus 93-53]KZT09524.1 hypothetical protein LAESUDRAFT_646353 [Laetiporus sulphureus 93-53]
MFGPATLSDLLGYASMGSWLGAQFPQIIENVRRQSADGLALPFLLNWAMGDATNLIGCILTHQLPFQTWLAAYFCFVDLTLLLQFFYYSLTSKIKPSSYLAGRSRTASAATRRMSIEREATHYRALSNVAANVAAAAALAAEQEEHARRNLQSLERVPYTAVEPPVHEEDHDDVSEEALARLADSFHSEGGRSGRQKKVSWSQERRAGSLGRSHQQTISPPRRMHASLHLTRPPQEVDPALTRGRSLSRDVPPDEEETDWASRRRSSRASRKGASMVFLGVWALFGISTLANGGQRNAVQSNTLRIGRVLERRNVTMSDLAGAVPMALAGTLGGDNDVDAVHAFVLSAEDADYDATKQPDHSTEFIIGRISAWICTTLYLTSRLPQIWKNYARKSVEGLSMYLFIFAFLGNLFYVSSILTSPKLRLPEAEATTFIKESIPYLMGSGGTLVFDVAIVTQSFLYRPKGHARGRRASRSMPEEEEALLSAGATGAEDMGTPSRRRTGATADSELRGS